MFGLVAVLRKVEIVRHKVIFVGSRQGNLHIEFTPSFLLDPERGGFDHCGRIVSDHAIQCAHFPSNSRSIEEILVEKKSIP